MTTEVPSQSLAGVIEGGAHRLRVRVYYEDTDFTGVVYHANYLKYFERGRSDYLRLLGIHHHQLAGLDPPLAFAVAEVNIRYRAAARIDEVLEVVTRLSGSRGAQVFLDQVIERDGHTVAQARIDVVCIDGQGRPRRLPKALSDVINAHVVPPGAD